jgi:hypothetical protein
VIESPLLTADDIRQYLAELNDELREMGVIGEVCLYGGAVMCIVYNARSATRDVDAVFKPVRHIRRAAGRIAQRHGLRKDWLNYAVKMFITKHPRSVFLALSHLTVYIPEPSYLLAMKTLAGRFDTQDRNDVIFLVRMLNIIKAEDVIAIVADYYPNKQIKPATLAFIKDVFTDE